MSRSKCSFSHKNIFCPYGVFFPPTLQNICVYQMLSVKCMVIWKNYSLLGFLYKKHAEEASILCTHACLCKKVVSEVRKST